MESSPSQQRRPRNKRTKRKSDPAADAAAVTYLLTSMERRKELSIRLKEQIREENSEFEIFHGGMWKELEVVV